ncbi:hypothetical protein JI739_24130 [Ramlibacter sp. AW1]|uniref:Uncharacterized protein n=1 Tax=Ramlibacter aurantiacus TaxID=2801330 RepID=A0A937D8V1_9BURK|nr:hypothetical protein [Ramlibacter aurantiacus]MBL0423443.1 hypothetical protein [Ramlibacter aurantiacus]
MGKKPTESKTADALGEETQVGENTSGESALDSSEGPTDAAGPDLTHPSVKTAIQAGQKVIADGGTKADAARAMFEIIKDEPKEVIVAAFVVGATLTEKGALTYWYNCKRKASKAAKP